jgi:hypothetical protein
VAEVAHARIPGLAPTRDVRRPSQPRHVPRRTSAASARTPLALPGELVRLAESEVHGLVKFLGGAQLAVDELVKGVVELSPCAGKIASLDKVGWQRRVEESQPRSEHASVRLGEENGGLTA